MQSNTMQCNIMQYNKMKYNKMQYNTMQCNTIKCKTVNKNTITCNEIQYNANPFLSLHGCSIKPGHVLHTCRLLPPGNQLPTYGPRPQDLTSDSYYKLVHIFSRM